MYTKVPDYLKLCDEAKFILIFFISSDDGDLFLHTCRARGPEIVAERVERRQGCDETKLYTERPRPFEN